MAYRARHLGVGWDSGTIMTDVVELPIRSGSDSCWGVTLIRFGADRVVATLDIAGKQLQPTWIVHGRVCWEIARTLRSIGTGHCVWGSGHRVAGVNNSTDFIHAVGAGTVLRAEVIATHRDRPQHLWQAEFVGSDRWRVACGNM